MVRITTTREAPKLLCPHEAQQYGNSEHPYPVLLPWGQKHELDLQMLSHSLLALESSKDVHSPLLHIEGCESQETSKPPQTPSLLLPAAIATADRSGFQTMGEIGRTWGNGRKGQEDFFLCTFLSLFF